MLFKIWHDDVDIKFSTFFQPKSTNTRQNHNSAIFIERANNNAAKFSFFHRTVPEWNQLDQVTIDSKTPESFKACVSKQVFEEQARSGSH